jgi:hypothetical protein
MQARYATHRLTRNAQQKAKILVPEFEELLIDPILQKLEDPSIEPGFVDPRNCLVFWARPPSHVKELVGRVQSELRSVAPREFLSFEIRTVRVYEMKLTSNLIFKVHTA